MKGENIMKITKVEGLANIANDIRIEIIEQVYNANSGHPGGSLSCADILAVLYFNQMNIDPENPNAKERDRFVLSKGHCAPALYATLARKGYFDKEQFTLLDENGKPSTFAPILIATLATCAELERDNIAHRLNSGYNQYRANGGKVGRKKGSVKSVEQIKEEYRGVIRDLESRYSIRKTAKLSDVSVSTVQRIKKLFCL